MTAFRVVFLVENMSFPRDRRVRQEAAALQGQGAEVSVICPRGKEHDTAAFEIVDGVRVYRYRQPWNGSGAFSYVAEYCWAMLCAFLLILRIWTTAGFDVLHVANPPDLFVGLAAPLRLLGKKIIYDQHDLCPEMFEAKFGRRDGFLYAALLFLERWSYRLADLIIVTNESFRDIAIERGKAPADKVCIVRNGPDLDKFRAVPPCPVLKRGAAYLAVYVGVMGKQDGVDRVLLAAQHIICVRHRQDIRFALLGTGECFDELKRLSHSLGIDSHIDFVGWVGDADLLAYLCTADVCLAPDPPVRMNQLSTMIKIMEYMSCKKPIVSFDLLESKRSAGPAAVYVEAGDPALFGDAVLNLMDDAQKRKQLGEVAWERMQTGLQWARSREVLWAGYERLLGKRRVPIRPLTTRSGVVGDGAGFHSRVTGSSNRLLWKGRPEDESERFGNHTRL